MNLRFNTFLLTLIILVSAKLYTEEPINILLMNSYHQGLSWADGMVEGVQSRVPDDIALYIEYMDTKRFLDENLFERLYRLYQYKYRRDLFDAIIASDDNAFQFMLDFRDQLFPGIPMIFCGVNDFSPSMLEGHEKISGILEKNDIKATLETAFSLLSDTDTVLVVTDNTTSGKAQLETIKAISAEFPRRIEFIYLNNDGLITVERLRSKLADAGENTIVYFSDLYLDGKGRYLDYTDYLPDITSDYDIPFFIHADFFLGLGPVGGKLISSYYQGRMAMEMVLKTLSGTPADLIPIESDSPNKYMFDYEQLKRFDIAESSLPNGSIIVNKELSLFEEYLLPIVISLAVGISLISLSTVLLINIIKRKKTEKLLSYERDLFHLLLDNIPDLIYYKDVNSNFLRINKALADMMGLSSPGEAIGKSDRDFFQKEHYERTRLDELNLIHSGQPKINFEENLITPKGDSIFISSTKLPLFNEKGSIIGTFGISRDITERKKHETEIEKSLREKELLLKEVHHRVKNNLAMISSLISLQSGTTKDEYIKTIFNELKTRIRSVALVHERLYRSKSLSSIDFNQYVQELVANIQQVMNSQTQSIKVLVDINDFYVPIDLAIPLGLIVNEMVTNSFKHAFNRKEEEKYINISIDKKEQQYILTVSDNGRGFPDDIGEIQKYSLGFQLIQALTEQLDASFSFKTENGAKNTLVFYPF